MVIFSALDRLKTGISKNNSKMEYDFSTYTSPNDFEVIHGFLRLGSFKKLIMSPVTNFLKENPSEFIFMRIINYKFDFEAEIRLQHDFIKNLEYRFYQNVFTSSTLTGQVCLIKDFCVSKNLSR